MFFSAGPSSFSLCPKCTSSGQRLTSDPAVYLIVLNDKKQTGQSASEDGPQHHKDSIFQQLDYGNCCVFLGLRFDKQ